MFDITNLPEEIIKEIFCFFDLNLFYKLTLQNKKYLKLKNDTTFWNFYSENTKYHVRLDNFNEYEVLYDDPLYGIYHINTIKLKHFINSFDWSRRWINEPVFNKYGYKDTYAKQLIIEIMEYMFLVYKIRDRDRLIRSKNEKGQKRYDFGIAHSNATKYLNNLSEFTKRKLDNYQRFSLYQPVNRHYHTIS